MAFTSILAKKIKIFESVFFLQKSSKRRVNDDSLSGSKIVLQPIPRRCVDCKGKKHQKSRQGCSCLKHVCKEHRFVSCAGQLMFVNNKLNFFQIFLCYRKVLFKYLPYLNLIKTNLQQLFVNYKIFKFFPFFGQKFFIINILFLEYNYSIMFPLYKNMFLAGIQNIKC